MDELYGEGLVLPPVSMSHELFVDETTAMFHARYRTPGPPRVNWLGYECLKCPMDLWRYQEILYEYKPDVVVEGGTCSGGSALFIASIMDHIGKGRVVTIDFDPDDKRPRHPRIDYIVGDTLDPKTVDLVSDCVHAADRHMLILDDGHDQHHVHKELDLYTPFLKAGDWLVVEDTNLGGPYWGLSSFLVTQPRASWIRQPDRLFMTFNPWGYWRKA